MVNQNLGWSAEKLTGCDQVSILSQNEALTTVRYQASLSLQLFASNIYFKKKKNTDKMTATIDILHGPSVSPPPKNQSGLIVESRAAWLDCHLLS